MVVGRLTPVLGWVLESNSKPGHIWAQFFARKPSVRKWQKNVFWLFLLINFYFDFKEIKIQQILY
jgi:hypothetical protein